MNIFRFKHFEVRNEKSAMKVNTDGVLLGASVHLSGNERQILDIGTGTGAIALMLAQRSAPLSPLPVMERAPDYPAAGSPNRQEAPQPRQAQILGIDIDPEAAEEAATNFSASAWSDRLTAMNISLAGLKSAFLSEYASGGTNILDEAAGNTSGYNTGTQGQCRQQPQISFDLIVSNPPFYDASLLNPDGRKAVARHAAVSAESDSTYRQQLPGTCPDSDVLPMGSNLSFREILDFSARHLSPAGRVAMISPAEQEAGLLRYARMCGLHLQNILRISTVEHKPPRRIIAEFGRVRTTPQKTTLTIMANGHYTGEYLALMKDFYLFA